MAGAHEDTRRAIVVVAQELMSRRGYTAVGINEIVAAAGVPKGSFYHYFSSKEVFGEHVMRSYFDSYLADMDRIFGRHELSPVERLMDYWRYWYTMETVEEHRPKCLAVKLGAEVADLSEPMREALETGTNSIITRIERMVEEARRDGSVTVTGDAPAVARSLYDLWLGASVRAKIDRDPGPLDNAMAHTRALLET